MGTNLHILVGCEEGKSYDLEDFKTYTVGRSSGNDIQIKDRNISRHHLTITNNKGMCIIKDLNSKNGTFINGKNLPSGEGIKIKEGVPIVIGMTVLGIGEISKSTLKPFLNAVGISKEIYESRDDINHEREMVIKKCLEFIYDMDRDFGESKDIIEISNKMLDRIFVFLNRIDRCVIVLIDENTGEILNEIFRSRAKIPVTKPAQAYNHELVKKSLKLNKPIMISDCYAKVDADDVDDRDGELTQSLQIMKIRSAFCIPINSPLGTRGALYIDALEIPNAFRKNDLALLRDVSGRAALAMENIALGQNNKNHLLLS